MIVNKKTLLFLFYILQNTSLFSSSFFPKKSNYFPSPSWKEVYYYQAIDQVGKQLLLDQSFQYVKNLISSSKKEQNCSCEVQEYYKFIEDIYKVVFQQKSDEATLNSERYQKLIFLLRLALDSSYYKKNWTLTGDLPAILLIQKICFVIFYKVELNMQDSNDLFKFKKNAISLKNETSLKDLNQEKLELLYNFLENMESNFFSIKEKTKAITALSTRRLYEDYLGICTWGKLDPISFNQIVSVKYKTYTRKNRQVVHHIRMPTPTIGSDEGAVVTPEFRAYLQYLLKRNLKHLYINFQDSRKAGVKHYDHLPDIAKFIGIADESYRSRAIEALEKEFINVFSILNLSKNNSFYNQSGKYNKELLESKYFIKEFILLLFDRKENTYKIPSVFKTSIEVKHDIESLLENLAKGFFGEKKYLTKSDRKLFIDISYAFITDFFSKDFFSLNQTCKDGVDRAGSASSLLYVLLLLDLCLREEVSKSCLNIYLEHMYKNIFFDAILNKERHILRKHFLRFMNAALFLASSFLKNQDLRNVLTCLNQRLI